MKKRFLTVGSSSRRQRNVSFRRPFAENRFQNASFYGRYHSPKNRQTEPVLGLKIAYESEPEQPVAPDVIPISAPEKPVPKPFSLRVESTGVVQPETETVDLKNLETEISRLEAVLFLAKEPWSLRRLAQYAHIDNGTQVKKLIEQLNISYRTRRYPYRIISIAGGYALMTRPQFSPWLRRLHRTQETQSKLSPSAIETLMIVADKQPVLRVEVEAVRGVQCGETLRNLMDRGYVRIVGRSDELGRPFLYGTTKLFLSEYGFNSLNDLPMKKNNKNLPDSENSVKDNDSNGAIKSGKSQVDSVSETNESDNNSLNVSPETPAVGATDVTVNSDGLPSSTKENLMLHTIDPSTIELDNNNTLELGDNVSSAVISAYNDDEENEAWDDDDDDDDDWDDEDEDWDDEDEDDEDYDDEDEDDDEDYDDWEEVEDDEDEDDDEDWDDDDEDWDDEDDEDEDDDEDWDDDDDYDDEDDEDN